MHLWVVQRVTAMLLGLAVVVHLVMIVTAVRGGLSAARDPVAHPRQRGLAAVLRRLRAGGRAAWRDRAAQHRRRDDRPARARRRSRLGGHRAWSPRASASAPRSGCTPDGPAPALASDLSRLRGAPRLGAAAGAVPAAAFLGAGHRDLGRGAARRLPALDREPAGQGRRDGPGACCWPPISPGGCACWRWNSSAGGRGRRTWWRPRPASRCWSAWCSCSMWSEAALVAGSCFVAAFCAGMAGFAFVLVAAGILLHVVSPTVTAPVLVLGSLMAQSMSLPALWKHIEWPRMRFFVGMAVLGLPVGLLVLAYGPAPDDRGRGRAAAGGLFRLHAGARGVAHGAARGRRRARHRWRRGLRLRHIGRHRRLRRRAAGDVGGHPGLAQGPRAGLHAALHRLHAGDHRGGPRHRRLLHRTRRCG